ncbi:MAG: 4-hydroxythreonine-4-phosphate dehydrogenase PdxA [Acetobacteraceae bacterium]|nr:4-hydroxythreonine-4-phosphate dehydrogenase PdxA [Acetobacteraceae bacterium]
MSAAPLALTMGDPAGIGGEITVGAWRALRESGVVFVALDDPARLAAHGAPIEVVGTTAAAASVFARAVPVLPIPLANPPRPGAPDPANAPQVVASIARAVSLALSGEASAVVTNPINKQALYAAGFRHPGHTEFLAELTGAGGREVMMLASPLLRVVPVTVHRPLREAIALLSTERIVAVGRTLVAALRRDFGIARPRIAVAGLNPHAGEGGALGLEETTIVAPAIAALVALGIDATGPWPPDTMFTEARRARYDAALCMYHDQALIPLKTLDMDGGVNVTLGLPIVRTSPDHGTAYDIAGAGVASPASLIAALRLAQGLAACRARAGQTTPTETAR